MARQLTNILREIRAGLLTCTGIDAMPNPLGNVSAGQINSCLKIAHQNRCYFIKLNAAGKQGMFEAEMAGLEELAQAACLRVPEPVFCGTAQDQSFIIMEYLELQSHGSPAALGEGLAALHQVTREQFGWKHENTIGLTRQVNTPTSDWPRFWAERRLGFQLELAAENGYRGTLQTDGKQLQLDIELFFTTYHPRPALLHGDLWAGNFAYLPDGQAVIYDPAVYFGDRETDLAMTELFGGFSPEFYSAYRAVYAPDPGYGTRKHLYNLYHVLNHLNLFGGAYLAQAESLLARLLAELR